MSGEQVRVVFTPSGLETKVERGENVLAAARSLGVDIDSVCGGRGICGRCQVTAPTGSFGKWALEVDSSALSAVGPTEANYAGKRPLKSGHRLSCQAQALTDVVIDVPPESQINRQVVRKEVNLDGITLDPTVRLHYLEIPKAVLGDDATATDLIVDALRTQWDLPGARVANRLLGSVHAAVTSPDGGATVAIRTVDEAPMVTAIWPGFFDNPTGIAIDVGSTTIAGHAVDLETGDILASAGRMNPQIRFGEDLMSRVSFVMMNPDGLEELTSAVRTALAELVTELSGEAQRGADSMLSITMVGNPVMHHILLGIDPTPLGAAPFLLATSNAVSMPATSLDLPFDNAEVYIGPCIAGHVGADAAAAILAEGPHRSRSTQLLVDIGTNAEIVLGNEDGLFAASSPTGPAFEGAQLSCGVRATSGAIERVRIDPDTFDVRFKVIGQDVWSDDDTFDHPRPIPGVCGSGIIEILGEMFSAGVMNSEGVIQGSLALRTDRIVEDGRTFSFVIHRPESGSELRVTQNDVRAIQLAKAALRAGIDLLFEHAKIDSVDDIRLAGAFGAHIDPAYAVGIGLVPNGPLGAEAVRSTGNSAGNGAVRLLLSQADRSEIERVVATLVTKIETATEPRFQELFVDAMAFPHRSESPAAAASTQNRRRRRPLTPPPQEPTDV